MKLIRPNKKQTYTIGNYVKLFLRNFLVLSIWCNAAFATPREQFKELLVQLRADESGENSNERTATVKAIIKLINENSDDTFLTIHNNSMPNIFAYLIKYTSGISTIKPLYISEICKISAALIKKINNTKKIKAAIKYAPDGDPSNSPLTYAFERAFNDGPHKKRLGAGNSTLITFLINNGLDVEAPVWHKDKPFIFQVIENDSQSVSDDFRIELLNSIAQAAPDYFKNKSSEMLVRTMIEPTSDNPRPSIHEKVLDYLLNYIISHNLEDIDKADQFGETLLHKAAKCKHEKAILTLLDHGANPNAQDIVRHNTPFHLLSYDPSKKMTREAYQRIRAKFEEKGANFSLKNKRGSTYQALPESQLAKPKITKPRTTTPDSIKAPVTTPGTPIHDTTSSTSSNVSSSNLMFMAVAAVVTITLIGTGWYIFNKKKNVQNHVGAQHAQNGDMLGNVF